MRSARSELYAYRPGRTAQQAVVEVEELLFRGHPEVVDADLADYFGSIPHAELLKSVARRIIDRRPRSPTAARADRAPRHEDRPRVAPGAQGGDGFRVLAPVGGAVERVGDEPQAIEDRHTVTAGRSARAPHSAQEPS